MTFFKLLLTEVTWLGLEPDVSYSLAVGF
jgi:hypothetical protein